MRHDLIYRWAIFPLWLFLSASICFRSPIPVDETRYLTVAWEMWLRNDFWVPFLNGHPYSHKPPLLFWLFQIGWAVFGVNDWWPKLVGPLFALLNLMLTRRLAEKLWPNQAGIMLLAPWILIATLLWTLFATSAMFDILLTCSVLLGMLGLITLVEGAKFKGRVYLALSVGLGLLIKGPVIFLHLLPTIFLIRYWAPKPGFRLGFLGLALSMLAGVCLALIWAIPAAIHGGNEYADAIFWHQTADRAIGSEIHVRPFLWYALFLPLVLFPWIVWPRFWKNLELCGFQNDYGLRFSLVWLVSTFMGFSILSSKQIHYLIPLLPAFALLTARVLNQSQPVLSLRSELSVPAAFTAIGGVLILLPRIPGLSEYKWAQTIQPGWGLSVILVAAFMAVAVIYLRRLTVFAISTALVAAVFAGFVFFFRYTGLAYDLRPAALQLKTLRAKGINCVYVGTYHGQLQFLGRLTQPMQTLTADEVSVWARHNAEGCLISLEKVRPAAAIYLQPHREYWLVFRQANQASQVEPL